MTQNNLAILSFKDMSSALEACQRLDRSSRMIEFGQMQSGNTLLIIACDKNPLPDLKLSSEDSAFIENPHEFLLKGYFKQRQVPLNGPLLILESKKLSELFFAADRLLKQTKFDLIEITRNPFPGSAAYAFFANGEGPEVLKLLSPSIHTKLITNASEMVLDLFR